MRIDPVQGVLWIIEDELLVYPFREGVCPEVVAKSGNTYNYEKLWAAASVSSKPFDYYPRGRVHVSADGRATVYTSPHTDIARWRLEIGASFHLTQQRILHAMGKF